MEAFRYTQAPRCCSDSEMTKSSGSQICRSSLGLPSSRGCLLHMDSWVYARKYIQASRYSPLSRYRAGQDASRCSRVSLSSPSVRSSHRDFVDCQNSYQVSKWMALPQASNPSAPLGSTLGQIALDTVTGAGCRYCSGAKSSSDTVTACTQG